MQRRYWILPVRRTIALNIGPENSSNTAAHWLRPLIPATREQVLRELIRIWRLRLSNPRIVIDGNTPLKKGFTPMALAEIDYADLDFIISHFGSDAANVVMPRMRLWLAEEIELTFGEIADLIAAHVQTVDASPLKV